MSWLANARAGEEGFSDVMRLAPNSHQDVAAAFQRRRCVPTLGLGQSHARRQPDAAGTQWAALRVQVAPWKLDTFSQSQMNIAPTLLTHPKFTMFRQALGQPNAVEYLLRLWGHCQSQKLGEDWGRVEPAYVEAICCWNGKPGELFEKLCAPFCGKAGWVVVKKNGHVIIAGWEEHNRSLLNSWSSGIKGGRPKSTRREPTANPQKTHGFPTANPQKTLLDLTRLDLIGLDVTGLDLEKASQVRPFGEVNCPPSLQEVLEHAKKLIPPCPAEVAEEFFRYWSGRNWMIKDRVHATDFRPLLASRWIFLQKQMESAPKKMAGAVSPVAQEIATRTRKQALEELIRTHSANPEGINFDEHCTVEQRRELTGYRREAEALTRSMAGKNL